MSAASALSSLLDSFSNIGCAQYAPGNAWLSDAMARGMCDPPETVDPKDLGIMAADGDPIVMAKMWIQNSKHDPVSCYGENVDPKV